MKGWLQGIWQWITGAGDQAGEDMLQVPLTATVTVGAVQDLVDQMVPQHLTAIDSPRFRAWLALQGVTINFTPFAVFRD